MELRIGATELARKLGEVLGQVRFRRDTFVIERNGEAVARLSPWPPKDSSLGEGLRGWWEAAEADSEFANDLKRVNRSDRPPRDPWV